jgi:hypothetical protein
VIVVDRSGLRHVERLASGDVREIVDDDDARHEVERRELACERTADVACSDDRYRRHGTIL